MPETIAGQLVATGLRFGIAVSRFNTFITERLLAGALDALERHGADMEAVDVVWVPGTFEIPIVTQRLAASGRYQAVICLGCLIRGGTPHFDYLAWVEAYRGLIQDEYGRVMEDRLSDAYALPVTSGKTRDELAPHLA